MFQTNRTKEAASLNKRWKHAYTGRQYSRLFYNKDYSMSESRFLTELLTEGLSYTCFGFNDFDNYKLIRL
jgi:hypothetical protein